MPTLIEKFQLDQKRRGLSPNTILLRNRQLGLYESEVGPLEFADEDKIQEWLDLRVKPDGNPISDKTRSGYLTTLSAFYKFCLKKKLLTMNPVDLIERPKVHNGMPNPIPEKALAKAIAKCTSPMLKCWIVLEAYGGLRCQEVAYLCHEDIRHDLRKVHIRFGKGGKQRMVTLHKRIIETLAEYEAPTTTGPLWPGVKPSGVSQRINRYFHSLGITHTAHQNRHRYGTQLYKASGEDLLTVQKALGHSDPKTSAIYAQVDDESMDTAVDFNRMTDELLKVPDDIGRYCICDPAFRDRGLLDPQCRHDDIEDLLEALYAAKDELAQWGWGDHHYGSQGQEQSVLDAIAKIDRVLP